MTRRQCVTRKGGKGNVCRKSSTHIARTRLANGLVQYEKIGCQGCVTAWANGQSATAYETTVQAIADAPPLVSTRLSDGTQGFIPSPTWSKVTT